MTDLTIVSDFTISLARETGELIKNLRDNTSLSHEFKNGNELVTNADLAADKLICDTIRANYPSHYILSEESSPDLADVQNLDKPVWIIDPIDGTVNFAHGLNQSAVSIAYAEAGQIEVAVVYNPFSEEMFTAVKGGGAKLNGVTIAVARESNLRRAIIATGFPYEKNGIAPMVRRVDAVLQNCADIRRLGSAALDICFLAAGRLDGYYESLSLWDFAAAQLIAKEAGAEYGHFSAVPTGVDPQFHNIDIVIANPVLYPQLVALLQTANQ